MNVKYISRILLLGTLIINQNLTIFTLKLDIGSKLRPNNNKQFFFKL